MLILPLAMESALNDINSYCRVAEVIGKRRSALSIEVDENFTTNQQDDR